VRKIQSKMIEWLDEKLKGNGLAEWAVKNKDPRVLMIEAAKACVGIREKTNKNDGPMVELIQKTLGGADKEPWCMAFVQTAIAYAETKCQVKSPLVHSEHCKTVWDRTVKTQRVESHPLPGAVAIWVYEGSSRGHTGIVLGADDNIFQAVEGNTTSGQKAGGGIIREGGGVYFTERDLQGFPKLSTRSKMKLVGFLKPF